jgi:hypothetical protein
MFALTFKANGIAPVLSDLTADEVRQQMEWATRAYPDVRWFNVTRMSDGSAMPIRTVWDLPSFLAKYSR